MSDLISSILSCLGISNQNNDSYPQDRPHLSQQEASQLQLNDFISRTLLSSPSVMQDRNAFIGLYSNLLSQNHPDPGAIARQVESIIVNLAKDNTQKGTNSWAIQLIGMAIDYNSSNYPAVNNQQHQNQGYSNALMSGNYQNNNNTASYKNDQQNGVKSAKIFVKPFFFPSEKSFSALVNAINEAESTLDICVFSITDNDITNVIIQKKNRGVHVRIISDDDQAKGLGSDIYRFRDEHQIEVRLDNMSSYMHNKFCVIDRKKVITGSYNWSKNARKNNQENIIITNSAEAINGFSSEFDKLWDQFKNQ
ncbi:Mitochondrial cardiolipin hydrolase [Smittium culicis]|uniref:Mitochondrial cardiolipin hydrolase n=1 Tax=Smittium culicis TaxID=133412 RepID=A0A1R1YC55_9FUNG|nr:Mitochondrial cardiolipin hydrolase [Smittium culicis]